MKTINLFNAGDYAVEGELLKRLQNLYIFAMNAKTNDGTRQFLTEHWLETVEVVIKLKIRS